MRKFIKINYLLFLFTVVVTAQVPLAPGTQYTTTLNYLGDNPLVNIDYGGGQRGKPTSTSPWIRKYIFPGGYIPSLSEIMQVSETYNINITEVSTFKI